jgi:hypothetical protein
MLKVIWRAKVDKLIKLIKEAANEKTGNEEPKQTLEPLPLDSVHGMLDTVSISFAEPELISIKSEAQDAPLKEPASPAEPRKDSPFKIPRPKNFFGVILEKEMDIEKIVQFESKVAEEIKQPPSKEKSKGMPQFELQDFGWQASGLYGPATVFKNPQTVCKESGVNFYPHHQFPVNMSKLPELERIMARSTQTSLSFSSSIHFFTSK